MVKSLDFFEQIWICDTEFTARPGEVLEPILLVAREQRTGREIRVVGDELLAGVPDEFREPRFLFVCYSALAEIGFMVSLGWPTPLYTLDLFAEFVLATNFGIARKTGLLDALEFYGLPVPMDSDHKRAMRELCIRGGPYTNDELLAISDYCAKDVTATETLFRHMTGFRP